MSGAFYRRGCPQTTRDGALGVSTPAYAPQAASTSFVMDAARAFLTDSLTEKGTPSVIQAGAAVSSYAAPLPFTVASRIGRRQTRTR
jgi:hypothetical protein